MSGIWPQRLAIVGTGLLGASVGLAALHAGVGEVVGFDTDEDEAGTALDVGALTARADLFHHAAWVLTPDPQIDPRVLRRMTAFVRELGGRPLVLEPELHDRVAAFASHLPQLAATALMGAVGQVEAPAALRSLIATGFRDTTRVAASDPDLWVDICTTNAEAILAALDELE